MPIPRTGPRSPGGSRRYPPLFPRRWGCRLHPFAHPPGSQRGRFCSPTHVGACTCMACCACTPREICQVLLRSLREFDKLVAEIHVVRQVQVFTDQIPAI
jgi:hypothetical protein